MSDENTTRGWYDSYHGKRGADRNDLRTNLGVLMQTLAYEACVVRAFYHIPHDPATASVLSVGCGSGADLYQLFRLGYLPRNTSGIDILPERLDAARELYPQVNFVLGNAAQMEFPDQHFDVVYESTMFATLPDEDLSQGIAHEMVRVCKAGGHILLIDWRTPKPRDEAYSALTRARMARLFGLGTRTALVATTRGALVPPVGRLLSRRAHAAYFPVAALCPALVGQVAYLLTKLPEAQL